jgi:ankyrin repeat protein
LRRRTWLRRSERTPPYADCYNIPKHWLEGEVRGHVVTFWGKYRKGGFTGEIMVGHFEAWWNHTVSWCDGTVDRSSTPGCWECRLEAVQRLGELLLDNPEFERLGVSFTGLNLRAKQAHAAFLHELLALCAAAVDALAARTDPPLLQAVEAGDLERARDLLEAGADPDEYGCDAHQYWDDRRGLQLKRPITTAVMRDDGPMVRILLAHGADVTTNPNLTVYVALENEKNQALAALFEGGLEPSPGGLPFDRGYPLQFAASKGNLEAVGILLEAGADPDDKVGFLSARQMASGPHKDQIRRLLDGVEADRDQIRGRLALATQASGGELSLSPQTEGGELSLTENKLEAPESDDSEH